MTRLRDQIQLRNILISEIKPPIAPVEKELQQSLVEVDQKDPIKVRKITHPNYQYEIVDGRRRFQAFMSAGEHSILALVVSEMDDTELAIQALVGNSGTANDFDEALHIMQLIQDGNTETQIAKMVRYSTAKVSTRLRLIEKLHPALFDMGLRGDIKVSAALEITKLPVEEQERLFLNGSEEKLSFKNVFEKVREWQAPQLEIEIENETKPGLFLTAEQVENLLNGEVVELSYQSVIFNVKRS